MKYSEWLRQIPHTLQADAAWTLTAYRHALFLSDLCWRDVSRLMPDRRTTGLGSQLYEAVGSVGANLAEGYSRGSGRDRARFYEYSLGSARESRDWYFKARHVLGEPVAVHRLEFIAQIIKATLTMIPEQRASELREESIAYAASELPLLETLLENVPLPI